MKAQPKQNFLERFLYAAGRSEVPLEYFMWSGVFAIAAALGNHVWVEKFGSRLYLNIMLFLIGPSAAGKGVAMKRAIELLQKLPATHGKIIQGKLTGAALADVFGRDDGGGAKKKKDLTELEEEHLVYYTPEMGNSLGDGNMAIDFIRRATDWFTEAGATITEATRTHGRIVFRNPVINWLGGSTPEWLHESVPRSAIESGFFGRSIPVVAKYDPHDKASRMPRPEFPADLADVKEWLLAQLHEISLLEGELRLTTEAWELHDAWYMERDAPNDPALLASWKRMDDMVLKLSALLSIADGRRDMRVKRTHVDQAITLLERAHQALPDLVKGASLSKEASNLDYLAAAIERTGTMPRKTIIRLASNRGMNAHDVNKYLATLIERGDVVPETITSGGRPATVYLWQGPMTIDLGKQEEEKKVKAVAMPSAPPERRKKRRPA